MKILIVIPAFNESESIERVIYAINSKCKYADYIIVNDGSTDNTIQKCNENGFNVIDLPVNTGLAGAIRAGMKYAKKKEYDYVIQIDGDGQHNPGYVYEMVEFAMNHRHNIVIGSRFVSAKRPWTARMIGSRLISFFIKLTTGKTIYDPTSGMRLYDKNVIKILADNAYPPEPDTIAYLIKYGIRVGEYQVTMNERIAGESYLNIGNSIKYMLKMISSILIVNRFRGGIS